MKKIWLMILGIFALAGVVSAQDDGAGMEKTVSQMSIPSSWGRLVTAVQTETGQLLYFEASNGDIHIVGQSTDLKRIFSDYYVIKRN